MPPLTALLLSDGKPGHYHQAEGVLAALARLRPLKTVRLEVRRRLLIPTRTLLQLINAGAPPALVLWLGYGVRREALPAADVVVSAGGETLAANAAAARLMDAANVFCGRLRRLAPEHVRVVIVAQERLAAQPNHLVALPPSPIEGRRSPLPAGTPHLGRQNPPRLAGVLIGGNSGAFYYSVRDWTDLIRFMRETHRQHGVRWVATTSRRSGPFIGDALAQMAGESGSGLERFVDYRTSGPGSVQDVFAAVDAIVCTDDSTTMISEAVGAQLPVVAVRPDANTLEEREREYRDFLAHKGWYGAVPISQLGPESFLAALEGISPRMSSPIDELADALRQRLPELISGAPAAERT